MSTAAAGCREQSRRKDYPQRGTNSTQHTAPRCTRFSSEHNRGREKDREQSSVEVAAQGTSIIRRNCCDGVNGRGGVLRTGCQSDTRRQKRTGRILRQGDRGAVQDYVSVEPVGWRYDEAVGRRRSACHRRGTGVAAVHGQGEAAVWYAGPAEGYRCRRSRI